MVLVPHGAWTPGVVIYAMLLMALPSFNVFASSWNMRAIAVVEKRKDWGWGMGVGVGSGGFCIKKGTSYELYVYPSSRGKGEKFQDNASLVPSNMTLHLWLRV
jgi:hypothetical protein